MKLPLGTRLGPRTACDGLLALRVTASALSIRHLLLGTGIRAVAVWLIRLTLTCRMLAPSFVSHFDPPVLEGSKNDATSLKIESRCCRQAVLEARPAVFRCRARWRALRSHREPGADDRDEPWRRSELVRSALSGGRASGVPMTPSAGSRIGPYEILTPLGAGRLAQDRPQPRPAAQKPEKPEGRHQRETASRGSVASGN